MGNSAGMILPKGVLDDLQIGIGQQLDLRVEAGSLIARPIRDAVRQGWAEAALDIRTAEDDLPVWPDFANDGDDGLQW